MKALVLVVLLLSSIVMPRPAAGNELLVFAASSLREPFIEIGQLYEQQSGQKVTFNFSGSQTLRTQIEFGAPADLYAAANPEIIKPLVNKNLVGTVHYFAGNSLVLLLSKKESPITRITDLQQDGIQIALGNKAVPIGKYTRQLLSDMTNDKQYGPGLVNGIWRNVRTQESSVKAIVTKVLLDEVDAGIVYQSDLVADVRAKTSSLELPKRHNPLVRYPAAVVRDSHQPENAKSFLELLLAPAGQEILRQNRFLPSANGRTQ